VPRNGEGFFVTSQNELEHQPAEINWIGRLDGGMVDKEIWQGKISAEPETLQARLGLSASELQARLEELKRLLNEDYLESAPQSSVRCIDGRVAGEDQADPKLGPQVPGGTPAAVISYRLANFEAIQPDSTLIGDLIELHNAYEELGIPFSRGAHIDEHSDDPNNPNTGCGAVDKMLYILQAMADPRRRSIVHDYAKAIAGENFDEHTFESILQMLDFLNQPKLKHRYFIKDGKTGDYLYKNMAVESTKVLSQGGESVERLLGEHNEVFLVVNKRRGETLNRDKFASRSNNQLQAFNYDSWHTVDRANALFDDEQRRRVFIVSRAMYAVATAMVLTDGSIELGIRS